MQTARRALFVHGGPGFTCEIERRWFGESLSMAWWDQPKHTAGAGPRFVAVTQALAAVVEQMAATTGRPVSIVAHSYGALLAREVADSLPGQLRELVLLGPGISLCDQLLRVGRHLLGQRSAGEESTQLSAAIAAASAHPSADAVLALAGAITSLAGWRRAYFSADSVSAYQRYLQVLPEGTVADSPTFAAGVGEHLASPPDDQASRFQGPVRVLVGRDDVSLDALAVVQFWQRVFPQAGVEFVSAGHMIQFELPPELWMPASD